MSSPLNDPRVEQWFQRLNAPLKRLPAEERAELHLEVRQHLDALVAANEELGSSPQEAWEHALAQFGDPVQIGRKMYQEWRQGRIGFGADIKAILFGFGLQAMRGTVVQSLFLLYFQNSRRFHPDTLFLWLGFPVTALIGFGIGRKYPYQALKSALIWPFLWPLGLWAEAAILHSVGWMRLSMSISLPRILLDSFHYNATTALLSCAIAYLASATKRGWYKPTLAGFNLSLPRRRSQRLSPRG